MFARRSSCRRGWLRAGGNDVYSIGFYDQDDLPFMGRAAQAFTATALPRSRSLRSSSGNSGSSFPEAEAST